jgi:SAM-dependent methyltransferase
MSFEDAMATVQQWSVATEALAAVAAYLRTVDDPAPADIDVALRAVAAAAGLDDLDQLPPPQRAVLAGLAHTTLRQSLDLLEQPTRPAGWSFTDPVILDGWGRGSTMVPPMLAGGGPELTDVRRLLDVGTGVGLLAIAAAGVWPKATITGIDVWEPSLERARANVRAAELDDRVILRMQDVTALDDTDAYDCAWVPTFFLDDSVLDAALARVVRATAPGGWIVLGLFGEPPVPLAKATNALKTIRGGGAVLSEDDAMRRLRDAGCASVHVRPRSGPGIAYVLGQRAG